MHIEINGIWLIIVVVLLVVAHELGKREERRGWNQTTAELGRSHRDTIAGLHLDITEHRDTIEGLQRRETGHLIKIETLSRKLMELEKPPDPPAETEAERQHRMKQEAMRKGFLDMMSYDVTKAMKGG